MKIYLEQNVFDAALDRIRRIFEEFPNVVVNMSGGKDSTVVMQLALIVAEEKNRLPLKVRFLDQEAEWLCVIDYIRNIMADDRVEPLWFQMPLRISNGTSTEEQWLYCWQDGVEWIREKEPDSIKKNVYGTLTFADLFEAINKHHYGDVKTATLTGVRAEESPRRRMGLTAYATYKEITWGKIVDKKIGHYIFHPLYDWSYTDVWKAIHDNNWEYTKLYDYMYQYGIKTQNMRVSNVHHETAIRSLYFLQEIEPENWNKITKRLKGTNTAGQLQEAMFRVTEVPYMFSGWLEYRDYLAEKLLPQYSRNKFIHRFKLMDKRYKKLPMKDKKRMYKVQTNSILFNDYHFTKLDNFESGLAKFRAALREHEASN